MSGSQEAKNQKHVQPVSGMTGINQKRGPIKRTRPMDEELKKILPTRAIHALRHGSGRGAFINNNLSTKDEIIDAIKNQPGDLLRLYNFGRRSMVDTCKALNIADPWSNRKRCKCCGALLKE